MLPKELTTAIADEVEITLQKKTFWLEELVDESSVRGRG